MNYNIEDSNNQCLNRHGYTNTDQDVYYAQRIQGHLEMMKQNLKICLMKFL